MMNKETHLERDLDKLLEFIMQEMMMKGIKYTTMDSIASSLKISKKTLYEIFRNKEEMALMALNNFHKKVREKHKEIFENSDNVMEAMVKCLIHSRNWMSKADPQFFRDVDDYFSNSTDKIEERQSRHHDLEKLFQKGVDEGYFRKELNFSLQCKLLHIQMESLKRMEKVFSKDISLLEAYDAISQGFLRSISTEKGIRLLEDLTLEIFNKE